MKDKIHITKQQWHEIFFYGVLWLVVFMAPAVDMYLRASASATVAFRWTDVFEVWKNVLSFFILFLVHNFLLAPRLLLRRKTAIYIVSVVCMLGVFQLWQEYGRWRESPHPRVLQQREFSQPPREYPQNFAPGFEGGQHIPHNVPDVDYPPRKDAQPNPQAPPFLHWILPHPDFIRLIIAGLMLGLNIAVKLLFKSQRDEEVMKELERQHLQQELEYLKYQINPHFFMNTLNNIHALIDIDANKAKSTILELSHLMRYVLYEGSSRTIFLVREMKFLQHYIALMRLRYTDRVSIKVDIPQQIPDEIQIPPLLYISFVENAFKHGVSYQFPSFIHLELRLDGNELFFKCINSKHSKSKDPYSGVGLHNVRKRLKLLYDNNYYLKIDEKTDIFEVLLAIPITL